MTTLSRIICTAVLALLALLVQPATANADVQPDDTHVFAPGVIKVNATVVRGQGWNPTRAIKAWRSGLPAGYTIKGVSSNCVGCINVTLVDSFPGHASYVRGTATWEVLPGWNGVGPTPWFCHVRLMSPSTPEGAALTRTGKRWLMAHEIGHCLGLSHRPLGAPSVMVPFITANPLPTPADLSDLHAVYTHLPTYDWNYVP